MGLDPNPRNQAGRVGRLGTAACLGLLLGACAPGSGPWFDPTEAPAPARRVSPDAEIYRHAQREYIEYLEGEIERLRADLSQAEEAMVAIESGLRGVHSRADAVSSLAEARIAVERLDEGIPWRKDEIQEARAKLDEAERQFQAGHSGSAVFFASRAQRIARTLDDEARQVAESESALFVHSSRVNLRGGPSTVEPVIAVLTRSTVVFRERTEGQWVLVRTPSGSVGWVHASLVRER